MLTSAHGIGAGPAPPGQEETSRSSVLLEPPSSLLPAGGESSIKQIQQVLSCQLPSTLGSAAYASTALLHLLPSSASLRLQREKEQLCFAAQGRM